GQGARGIQIAGRGDLLAANDVLMTNPGKVDGRPLTAMNLLDGGVVVLQGTNANLLAPRLPFYLIADLQTAICDRSRHDRTVSLYDEGTVDGEAKPLFAALLFDLLADALDGRLQLVESLPRDGRGADDGGGLQEGAFDQVAHLQLDHLAGCLVHT